ncbi:uncharacterized protein LOC128226780 [Mya arenaria]|uniref:uncharacterized protein LOC128226780 n=1 Tax=Mya arenaria TaxID=6604 RepID=UPI0022E585D4|nr:uncharacterized protein LOC128226780 [Mya arenaria]
MVPGSIPAEDVLSCRRCLNAKTIDTCTTSIVCDNRTEECYMDEVITPNAEVVYRAGCRSRQACFARNHYHGGSPLASRYGCFNFEICKLLMRRAFDDLKRCYGIEDTYLCDNNNDSVCNVCCRDGGCNYGDCQKIKRRLFEEYKQGLFSLDTLKSTTS